MAAGAEGEFAAGGGGTGTMVIEGGGDFPDEAEGEPNFNRDGVAHVGGGTIGLMGIVRMVEIVAAAAEGPVVGTRSRTRRARRATWWWRAGSRTRRAWRGKTLRVICHGFSRIHMDKHGRPRCESWPFLVWAVF